MSFAFVIISHFMRNGLSVDDLGLLIVVVAVIILITGVIRHAARVLAFMILPPPYRDVFFPPDPALSRGVILTTNEDSPSHVSDLEGPIIVPEEEQDNVM